MLKVYTGQFAKHTLYKENNLLICSIARFEPYGFTGPTIKQLAPSEELLNNYNSGLSIGAYISEFTKYLESLDLDSVVKKMESLSLGYDGIVLCCYEPLTQFCHRHLVASYLTQKAGLRVSEFV